MITSMYEVKRTNGGFDGTSDTEPDASFDSSLGYSVGYRLLVENGTDWTCQDATVADAVWLLSPGDESIEASILQMTELLFDYLNDPFRGSRPEDDVWISDLVFVGDTATSVGDFDLSDGTLRFYTGDTVRLVRSVRNDSFYTIEACDADSFTVDRAFRLELTDPNSVYISLVDWPIGLKPIAAQMVAYNVYHRGISDKSSENIGNYSYSKEDLTINGIAYPTSVTAGLSVYKVPKYV